MLTIIAKKDGNRHLFACTANQMAANRNGKIATRMTALLTTLLGLPLRLMAFWKHPPVLMLIQFSKSTTNLMMKNLRILQIMSK